MVVLDSVLGPSERRRRPIRKGFGMRWYVVRVLVFLSDFTFNFSISEFLVRNFVNSFSSVSLFRSWTLFSFGAVS